MSSHTHKRSDPKLIVSVALGGLLLVLLGLGVAAYFGGAPEHPMVYEGFD